ncbi:MAG: alpha/beta hydrolase [Chloroflexota bacterium]|nr:MAG: alpha/beta hydrolase [Chloroflexota bacterium]
MIPTPPLHHITSGDGPPVILLHGIAASHHDWDTYIPPLVAAGYKVFALDLPGHGDSPKPDHPPFYRAESVYSQVEQWIASLGLSQPPLLLGHSLGGYMSLRYAQCHPNEVGGLALIDPFYSIRQVSPFLRLGSRVPRLGAQAYRLLPEWMIYTALHLAPMNRDRCSGDIRRQVARDCKRASPHVLHIPNSTLDLTSHLPFIGAKTLVIWGDKDPTLRPGSFPPLVRLMPNASGRPVRGSGHQPHIGRPDIVFPLVLDFFKS